MKSLQPFNYEGVEVRTVTVDGEPWFVAKDVCAVLGITNGRDAVGRLDADGVGTTDVIDSLGRTQSAATVSESGLYELVFQSRRPEAKAFRRWVTQEVLPQLRRTGSYGQQLDIDAIDPRTLALAILEESDRANAAEAQVKQLEPKANAFEKFLKAEGALDMGTVANIYKVGRQTLFDWLRMAKVIQQDRRPYQEFAHWFDVKATSFERASGATGVSYSSKVLPSGLEPLFKLLVRRGYIVPEAVAS